MRLNIPFMPLQVDLRVHAEARWRRLPPVQFSVRGVMLAVAVVEVVVVLWNEHGRLGKANNEHYQLAFHVQPPGVDQARHAALYRHDHAAFLRNALRLKVILTALSSLALFAAAGRLLNRRLAAR